MAVFQYTAKDMTGRKLTGELESASRTLALNELLKRKIIPIRVRKIRSVAEYLPAMKKKIRTEEIIMFSRQLMTMLKAGIDLLTCLNSMKIQTENPELKKVITDVYSDVSNGNVLSAALSKHPRVFNEIYVSTIRIGEEGGVLDEVIERLIALLEHETETKAALKQAVRYPLMVVGGIVICFGVSVVFVLPRFGELYGRFETNLPLPTRILLMVNDVIQNHMVLILVGIVLVVGLAVWGLRSERGKQKWDELKLKLPIVGPLFVRIAVTRFARMFATLDRCGIPVLKTLEIVADSVGNIVIAREVMQQRESVRRGKSISEPLKDSKYFPPLVSEMLSIGEATGSMEEVLGAVSDHYDREINYTIKNLTTLIEPVITIVMGVFILFMALAVFMPMWKMSTLMGK